MYYVYALIDPRTNAPFYIGKGQGKRLYQHEVEARRGTSSKKCARIRAIWDGGLEVIKVKIREFSDEDAAYEFEKARIAEIGPANLTNATLGGRCPTWLIVENGVRGDIEILRTCAKFRKQAKYFPRRSLFDKIYEGLVPEVLEVIKRRGLQWVNSYSHRTGLVIENNG